MTRLFTISFMHDDVQYSAVVSVHETTLFTEYILGKVDEKIRDLLPSMLVIETDTEMCFRHQTGKHPVVLLNDIIESIQSQLALIKIPT